MTVAGVVLAAGSGSRLGLGVPKALVADPGGRTWLERAVAAVQEGGASPVFVVVGADAAVVTDAVPAGCSTLTAADWESGMGASLRVALTAISGELPDAEAALVMLVDTPGVGPEVVQRLLDFAGPAALVRAAYGGWPGHPVLIGRSHWSGVLDTAVGDRGARDYLATADVHLVECGDVGSGEDVDTPEALAAWLSGSAWGFSPDRRS